MKIQPKSEKLSLIKQWYMIFRAKMPRVFSTVVSTMYKVYIAIAPVAFVESENFASIVVCRHAICC